MNLKIKFSRLKDYIWRKLEPHREYVGEEVYRTKVFWSQMFSSLVGAFVFQQTESFYMVILSVVIMHIVDFGFYLIQENLFNFNPMEGSVGRRN